MITEPWFWHQDTLAARMVTKALTPATLIYDTGQRLRAKLATPTQTAIPVLCIGNATLGGVGKTPTALAIEKLLLPEIKAVFLSRGYQGEIKGPITVDTATHSAKDVGDEALLLARRAPTIVAKNRAAGARFAESTGNHIIIMDDGFQNPTVEKSFSLLLLSPETLDHKMSVFPSGPLREPLERAITRADAIGFIGPQNSPSPNLGKPVFKMALQPIGSPRPERVLAFCAIGNPSRFFQMLASNGYDVAGQIAFPDHAYINQQQFSDLEKRAKILDAKLITTEKDCIRLAPELRDEVRVYRVEMVFEDADGFIDLALSKMGLSMT